LNGHGHFKNKLRAQRCRDCGRWTQPCHTVPISQGSTAFSEEKFLAFLLDLYLYFQISLFIRHHNMKMYGGWRYSSRVFNLGTRRKWVVRSTPLPLYPWYPSHRRICGPEGRPLPCRDVKKSLPPAENRTFSKDLLANFILWLCLAFWWRGINILSRIYGVTIDGVWIGDWIYWTLVSTTRNYR
jgi:hypothetical protein